MRYEVQKKNNIKTKNDSPQRRLCQILTCHQSENRNAGYSIDRSPF